VIRKLNKHIKHILLDKTMKLRSWVYVCSTFYLPQDGTVFDTLYALNPCRKQSGKGKLQKFKRLYFFHPYSIVLCIFVNVLIKLSCFRGCLLILRLVLKMNYIYCHFHVCKKRQNQTSVENSEVKTKRLGCIFSIILY